MACYLFQVSSENKENINTDNTESQNDKNIKGKLTEEQDLLRVGILDLSRAGYTRSVSGCRRDKGFSLLRQEYPPILTSGEMLSHPGGWDKPIPEVIHLWRHRTSMPNSLEKSRVVFFFDIFCRILGKNEKNNQSPHWGRDSGIPSSCPGFATSTTRQASSWIANLGHSDGIPSSLPQCGVRFYYRKNASGVVTFLHVLRCIVEKFIFLLTGGCLSIAAARARIVYFLPPDCAHCCGTS